MALTPQKIQDLADPIEQIYIDATEDLLANIGRHLRAPSWTHTAVWEVNKLAEMGQLTAENARILNNHIKSIPKAIRDTMEGTRAAALDRLEKQLEDAVKSGALPEPMKDSTADVLKEYSQQAADHLNLVNTTMLQSSLNQYARAVQLTAEEERRVAATQAILNQAAGDVNLGVETRETALRKAIGQIADEGLTGFYDRAGRKWTPEAYVNMDIRTTVHNTAIQSVKNRMQDFNTSVFQVSSHAAARPLCYPYQGKFYSWDNTAGQIELGDGRTVSYEPLNSTSYGMPAGLFGINCGHYPIPVVPGVTIPHGADNIQPEKENDAAYAESQKQRALERDIRAKKRVLEMAGDLATDEQKAALKRSQEKMRQFIAETGRTRRYDRERIGGTQGAKLANTQRQTAPTQQATPKEDSEFIKRLKGWNIDAVETKRFDKQPTEEQIIDRLGGGDLTRGSCSSLAFAYVGNRGGIDVLDFRDGDSRSFFSRNANINEVARFPGVKSTFAKNTSDFKGANEVLKAVESGKEYYFACAKHAAVIRKDENEGFQYMELQSSWDNGWHKLTNDSLKWRFGAQKSHSVYGQKLEAVTVLIEAESLYNNDDFKAMLPYINTEPNKQRKGTAGHER